MGMFDGSGDVGRRKFLTGIIGVVAGAVGVLVGLPAIGYLISPGLKNQSEDVWLVLGPLADLEPGKPRGFPYSRTIKDGWTETNQTGVAYAVTHDGANVKVFSDVCTHLQCRVSWKDDRQIFLSPCHDGRFSIDGEVISGPPPRPLDQFETKIENGQISILLT
jgi:menaquinol-cytochrome c reductase iron-sulfur subunit